MTYLNESADEMPGEESKTSNIDRLLRRDDSPISDEDLRRFIASFSIREEPPRDVEQMGTALAATARASAPAARPRASRRLAVLAGAGALVIALGGVAMASDESVPGDPLYGLDRALETIGIGDGGIDERIVEFDALMDDGQEEQAYEVLADSIEESEGADLDKAMQHLELAATRSSPDAESAQQKMADLQTFVASNRGIGVGLDGQDFGQEVANIARSDHDEAPGNSQSAPGQQDDSSSEVNPGTAPAPQNEETPGKSEDAPGQQDDPGTEEPGDSPGNSENAPGHQDDEGPGNSGSAPGQQKKDE